MMSIPLMTQKGTVCPCKAC